MSEKSEKLNGTSKQENTESFKERQLRMGISISEQNLARIDNIGMASVALEFLEELEEMGIFTRADVIRYGQGFGTINSSYLNEMIGDEVLTKHKNHPKITALLSNRIGDKEMQQSRLKRLLWEVQNKLPRKPSEISSDRSLPNNWPMDWIKSRE